SAMMYVIVTPPATLNSYLKRGSLVDPIILSQAGAYHNAESKILQLRSANRTQ
ncbi:MAG: hypothetical protein H6Q05_4589, partial [Acidobacteria bacterium]|nr:hypothetical protein [Acidobacteriota bacterium]